MLDPFPALRLSLSLFNFLHDFEVVNDPIVANIIG
jgi:hypothetical protein